MAKNTRKSVARIPIAIARSLIIAGRGSFAILNIEIVVANTVDTPAGTS